MAIDRPGAGPGIDRSKSIEDLHHLRLMALLDEQVRDKGPRRAASDLDVDHRTLTSSLESGRLTRRMRVALNQALLAGAESAAREQRERNDDLAGRLERVEGRVEEVGNAANDATQGLAAVQDEVKALRNDYTRDLQRVESRLARVESGGVVQDERASGESGAGGQPTARPKLRREFPELATLEAADDDPDVFGDAWPLIQEWRKLKETHPNRGKGLDWLRRQERLLAVELALLEEHGLTLPPETYPLQGLDRGAQVNWRGEALEDARGRRARRELLHRALTFGWWRK